MDGRCTPDTPETIANKEHALGILQEKIEERESADMSALGTGAELAGSRQVSAVPGGAELERPEHEALARWIALPEELRPPELRTGKALAVLLNTSHVQLWRWKQRQDVLARAGFLSGRNRDIARVRIRADWEAIVDKQKRRALDGDLDAAKWLRDIGWDAPARGPATVVGVNVSLGDAARESVADPVEPPSWLPKGNARRRNESENSAPVEVDESETGGIIDAVTVGPDGDQVTDGETSEEAR